MTLKKIMGLLLYECPICGKIDKNKKTMISHLRKYHPGVKMRDVKRINTKTYEYLETKVED